MRRSYRLLFVCLAALLLAFAAASCRSLTGNDGFLEHWAVANGVK